MGTSSQVIANFIPVARRTRANSAREARGTGHVGTCFAKGFDVRPLAAGNSPDDEQWFGTGCDFLGERRVGRLIGEILLTGVEADEVAALTSGVVADGAAEHRVAGFQRVEDGSQRDGGGDVELHLAGDLGESFQVVGDDNADHEVVGQTFLSAVVLCRL